MNAILLASAVVPVAIVIVGSWLFLRAGRRHDERENGPFTDKRAGPPQGPPL